MMRHGSLFSGIGGFDLAAEWMGWENVFHCEWMEFPRKVLDYYWPNADSHIDICKTDFKKYANTIDILTGGFPCQPFSTAGKRKGTNDERYLWHEMLRAINEIKPKFVIAENVYGITNIDGGLVFEQVCLDLEAVGYEVQPYIIPACAKNAPHRRDRVWFVAYRNGTRLQKARSEFKATRIEQHGELGGTATDTNSRGLERTKESRWDSINVIGKGEFRTATDTSSNGLNDQPTEKNNSIGENNKQSRTQRKRTAKGLGDERSTTNTNGTNNKTWPFGKVLEQSNGEKADGHSNVECPNQWQNFPTQSPICGGDDGLPTELDGITFSKWRNESIKAYGNAIVPQVAYELFKCFNNF